jgi:hypothetical protein
MGPSRRQAAPRMRATARSTGASLPSSTKPGR